MPSNIFANRVAQATFAWYRQTLSTRRLVVYFEVEILLNELERNR
jgi:hypothetical protein